MTDLLSPTPYPAVNEALRGFHVSVQAILGRRLRGLYLCGSLAVGDCDPATSDLDMIAVTDCALSDDRIAALHDLHARYAASDLPWGTRLEAVSIPHDDLRSPAPACASCASYPQVERDRPFFVEPLEPGCSVQRYTLREYGLMVAGPAPHELLDPIDPDEMLRDGAIIAATWLHQAEHDTSWLDWTRPRPYFAFVVATLCRLLYTLETGAVASKPAATDWAQETLDSRWAGFIARSWAVRQEDGDTPLDDMETLFAFIRYTVEHYTVTGYYSAE